MPTLDDWTSEAKASRNGATKKITREEKVEYDADSKLEHQSTMDRDFENLKALLASEVDMSGDLSRNIRYSSGFNVRRGLMSNAADEGQNEGQGVDAAPASKASTEFLQRNAIDLDGPSIDIEEVVLNIKDRLDDDMRNTLFIDDFEQDAKPEIINIASVPTSEIARREREVEKARLRDARAQAKAYHERELDLAWREQNARNRVLTLENTMRRRAREEDQLLRTFREDQRQSLKRNFHRAKTHLESTIARQSGRIHELYGQPMLGQRAAARRYAVDWNSKPRPIEVRVHMLRCVREKLPRGQYSMLMSMYDRLGGCPLQWSKNADGDLGNGQKPAATKPTLHQGRYYDGQLRIDQTLFAICPSNQQLHPSNVFIFELYRLADTEAMQDEVVAWGALPMCDGQFSVVKGSFKIPLLKGHVDRTIDLHYSLETMYREDLSRWLSNLYLEVRHLPREMLDPSGKKENEFDVEFDFVNNLLRLDNGEIDERNSLRPDARAEQTGATQSDVEESDDNTPGWFQRRKDILGYTQTRINNSELRPSSEGADLEFGSVSAINAVDDSNPIKGDPLYRENEILRDEGYGSGDEYFFPPETLTHVVGVEATTAGISGIRKRRRGDGARWEPGGLALLQKKEKKAKQQIDLPRDDWRILETESDMALFTMSVAPDEGRRGLPRRL